jgi:hypothetical protein
MTAIEDGKESPYGTMELITEKTDDTIRFKDSICLDQNMTKGNRYDFVRTLTYNIDNMFVPLRITIDLYAGEESNRIVSYEKGVFSEYNQEPIETDFSEGILTYNAMLRLVRMIDFKPYQQYLLREYAEPFLFRVHNSKDIALYLEILDNHFENKIYPESSIIVVLHVAEHKTIIWLNDDHMPIRIEDRLPHERKLICILKEGRQS